MADTNPNEERPLEAWLESFGPFGVLEALPILEALATTLVELHAAGLVHARLGHEHVRVLERDGTCVLSLPEPWGEQENPALGFTREADLRTLGQLATRLLTGSEPQRTGGPKGPIRPLWLVEPRLPFELSALIHALVRDGSRDLPKTASVKERLSLLLAELEGSLPDQERSAAPLGSTPASSEPPPRRTTTTTFATADVIAKLLEKPPAEPVPPSPVPWGVPATPVNAALRADAEHARPKQGRLATRQELPAVTEGRAPSGHSSEAPRTPEPPTEPPEGAVGAGVDGGTLDAPRGKLATPAETDARATVAPATGSAEAPGRGTKAASATGSAQPAGLSEKVALATGSTEPPSPAEVEAEETGLPFRVGRDDDAVATVPAYVRDEEASEDAIVTSPGQPRLEADDAIVTAPGHVHAAFDDDEVVATSPGHVPAPVDEDRTPANASAPAREAVGEDPAITAPAHARDAVEDEAAGTSPGEVAKSAGDEAAASPRARTGGAAAADAVGTVPAYVRQPEEDEAVSTSPGHVPEPVDEGAVATSLPARTRDGAEDGEAGTVPAYARAAAGDDVVSTVPAYQRDPAGDDAVSTVPGYVREAEDEDAVRTSPGHVPAGDDAGTRAAEETPRHGGDADAANPPLQLLSRKGETPTGPGEPVRSRDVAASAASGATGSGDAPDLHASSDAAAAAKAHGSRRSPSGTSAPAQLAGEQATALGPDPRRSPRRTPGSVAGVSPRVRTPSRPRGSEPDEPTRAAPRTATPPRPMRPGPARPVFGGAAAEARPSRAKLVIGGGDTAAGPSRDTLLNGGGDPEARPSRAKLVIGGGDPEARPSRAKLVIGGGEALASGGAPVTTRSETQDLALEPWALPTVQVTVPEDILGPLPGPLRRLGAQTPSPARAFPGEVALPRHSVLLRAAADARPPKAEEVPDEDGLEPTRPLEPLPSPDAPWLSETVHPDERLTPAEVLRLIPIWVWVLLAILVLGLALIFGSTAPTDSRVLPEERRMMPGLEASAAPGP